MSCDRKHGNGELIDTFGASAGLSKSEGRTAYHVERKRIGTMMKEEGKSPKRQIPTDEAVSFFRRSAESTIAEMSANGASQIEIERVQAAFDSRISDIESGNASLTAAEMETLSRMPGVMASAAAEKAAHVAVREGTRRPSEAKPFNGFAKRVKRVVAGVGAAGVLAGALTGCSVGEEDRANYVAACVEQSTQLVLEDERCEDSALPQEGPIAGTNHPNPHVHTPNAALIWMYLNTRTAGDVVIGQRVPSGATAVRPKLVSGDGVFTVGGRAKINNGTFGEVEGGKIKGFSSGGYKPSSISSIDSIRAPKFGGFGGGKAGGIGG